MKKELMDILACPMCKGDLELNVTDVSDSVDEVITGTLYCKKCDEYYPIEDGIPNMLPPNLRD
ncbi:MAG: methytransferase partner Trm112 [Methanosarcinales archaeon]|nr:methytransferase partner Trm112 [Methanosarcinales archaeon]